MAVTGATGLVGRAVLRAAALGDWQLTALYRSKPAEGVSADWVRGDLADDAALATLCAEADVVLHIAGATAATTDKGFHAVNVAGAARVAEAARAAGAERFVLVSSQAAGVPGLSRYARSKAMGETAVRRAAGDEMEVCIVRPPAVFGPGDEATKPILDALSRGILPVPGGRGWQERRFALVTAADLADELLAVARDGGEGVFVPASYAALSWQDLADAAHSVTGHPVRIVPVPATILSLAGHGADVAARLTGRASVFGAGKAAEMTCDWRTGGSGLANQSLADALRPLLSSKTGRDVRVAAATPTEASP